MLLETPRLLIREFTFEDLQAVHRYASHPEVVAHMVWGPNTLEETEAFLRMTKESALKQPRVDYEIGLELKETGQLIGGCGFHLTEPKQAELGYVLHPDFWRQGFATEAAGALVKLGFEELGLHRIYATCRPANIGSAKVMEAVGMTFEGRLKEHMWHKGGWHDSLQYSILEQDYAEQVRRSAAT